MKRNILSLALALSSCFVANAIDTPIAAEAADGTADVKTTQTTTRVITGAVIDKNGNPLPGATVTATGGAETVTVDADGTFSIEVPIWLKSLTASYPGLSDKKLKTSNYDRMIFTLKSSYRTYGFVNLMFANVMQVSPLSSELGDVQQLGIMGGAYRSWGGYAKVMMGLFGGGKDRWGDRYAGYEPTATGGAIKRINNYLNVFLGAGVAFNYGLEAWDYTYDDYGYSSVTGCAELGVMAKWKRLNVVAGVTYVAPSDNEWNDGNISIFCGVGINI